jgi:hypothetical protein
MRRISSMSVVASLGIISRTPTPPARALSWMSFGTSAFVTPRRRGALRETQSFQIYGNATAVFNSSEIKNDSVRKQSGRKYNRLPYHTKPYICNIVTTNTHPKKFGKRYAVDLAPA